MLRLREVDPRARPRRRRRCRARPSRSRGPAGCSSVRSSCHTGRSKRHPHQEAHATSRTFLPCSAESENGFPSRSGSVTSGSSADSSARPPDSGPERPQPVLLVVHQRHAEPLREHPHVEAFTGRSRAAARSDPPCTAPSGLISQPVRAAAPPA